MLNVCENPGLMPFDQALAALCAEIKPQQAVVRVPIGKSLGFVLAADQRSLVDVPPNDNSAMDGYAVNSADLDTDSNVELPVGLRVPAGSDPDALPQGQAARIFTGAKVPAGADTVIKQEDCQVVGDKVVFPAGIAAGQNIRRQGQDIRTNDVLICKGVRLKPQHLGVLASVGIAEVEVYQPLKVAIMSTGDELVEPGAELAPGQIYNSNRYTLTGLIEALGFELVDMGIVEDTPEATDAVLRQAAERADVIISSGGVSVGEEDHIKGCVEALGSLDLWKVAIKPGKPFAFGEVLGKPFLGLPGNPAAVLVTFNVLARPYLLTMQGDLGAQVEKIKAPIRWQRKSQVRQEYLRAKLIEVDGKTWIEPAGNQSSGVLSTAVWANGYAEIPPNTVIQEGDEVNFIRFNDVFY